jgi:hypothetical protein
MSDTTNIDSSVVTPSDPSVTDSPAQNVAGESFLATETKEETVATDVASVDNSAAQATESISSSTDSVDSSTIAEPATIEVVEEPVTENVETTESTVSEPAASITQTVVEPVIVQPETTETAASTDVESPAVEPAVVETVSQSTDVESSTVEQPVSETIVQPADSASTVEATKSVVESVVDTTEVNNTETNSEDINLSLEDIITVKISGIGGKHNSIESFPVKDVLKLQFRHPEADIVVADMHKQSILALLKITQSFEEIPVISSSSRASAIAKFRVSNKLKL